VDTYCKVAHAKLYTTKTPITAADLLNDRVLPFYEEHDLPVLRILRIAERNTVGESTNTTSSSSWRPTISPLMVCKQSTCRAMDHPKTKVRSPQTNGICERFHSLEDHKTVRGTAFPNERSCRSFTRSRSAKRSINPSRNYRLIWMNGWGTTTPNELIRVKCVALERHSRP